MGLLGPDRRESLGRLLPARAGKVPHAAQQRLRHSENTLLGRVLYPAKLKVN